MGGEVTKGEIPRRLACRPPFAAAKLLSFLGTRAVVGLESVQGSTYRRSARAADGTPTVVSLTPDVDGRHVDLEVGGASDPDRIVRAARRAFDLDADPAAIDGVLGADPILSPLVRRTPGLRVPGTVDGFELAVRAVLGQQVSVAAARTLAGRLTARFGDPVPSPAAGITHAFPTPERLAGSALEGLGLTTARAATIRRLAEAVRDGRLDLSGRSDLGETIGAMGEVPGVGVWTVAYVSMRALGDPDAFPASDLGIRRAFEELGLDGGVRSVTARAERWRPWRAYGAMHLWSRPRA